MSWNPRRLLAPPSTPHLERTADVIGCFINSLGLLWAIASATGQWTRGQMSPRDTLIVSVLLPLTAATAIWIAIDVARRRPARTPLVVHTTLCFAQVLVFVAFWQAAPGQVLPPMTFPIELAAAASWTCLAWPVGVFDLLFTVSLGGIVMARTRAMGESNAFLLNLGNSAYYGAIGLVATMAWSSIVTVVRMGQRASDESAASAAQLVAAQEAAAASNRWDGVIHDHVLNALGAVFRSGPHPASDEPVRILAREALVTLRRTGDTPRPAELAERLAATAIALGLHAELDIRGEPPAPIAARIARAAAEALTNVARHAGTTSVVVTGRFSSAHAELMVRDDGCGFDPARVADGRHGLHGSIIGAMEVRGGRARIDSVPGRGTTVILTWEAPSTEPIELRRLGYFRAMVGFFALTLAIALSLGWVEHGAVNHLGAQIVLTAVLVGEVVLALVVGPLRPGAQAVIAIVAVGCQTAMLGNLRPTDMLSWQEWFIGFGVGVFAPLAWRTKSRLWVVVVAVSWPVVTIGGSLISGARPLAMMLGRASSYTWPLILSFAAAWAASSMSQSLRTISQSRAETLDTVRQRARADAARHEAERRAAAIKGEPMDMLDYLAAGGVITDAVRHRCVLLEASTRDLLMAPFILDETMRIHFRRARERGAAVTITGGDPVDAGNRDAAEAFRAACVAMADQAGEGHRLTCRWHPASHGDSATVALASDNGGAGGPRQEPWQHAAQALLTGLAESSPVAIGILDAGEDLLVTIGE